MESNPQKCKSHACGKILNSVFCSTICIIVTPVSLVEGTLPWRYILFLLATRQQCCHVSVENWTLVLWYSAMLVGTSFFGSCALVYRWKVTHSVGTSFFPSVWRTGHWWSCAMRCLARLLNSFTPITFLCRIHPVIGLSSPSHSHFCQRPD